MDSSKTQEIIAGRLQSKAVETCGCSSVDRVLASEAKGRGFDPRQPHQTYMRHPSGWRFCLSQSLIAYGIARFLSSSTFVMLRRQSGVEQGLKRVSSTKLAKRNPANYPEA